MIDDQDYKKKCEELSLSERQIKDALVQIDRYLANIDSDANDLRKFIQMILKKKDLSKDKPFTPKVVKETAQ